MRVRQIIAVLGLSLATVIPSHGQDPQIQSSTKGSFEQIARGQWRTYGVTDGLGALDVWAIFRDRDGNMWFGTEGGGVSRYDGDRWTQFTVEDGLVESSVYAIVQDADGDLWFGSGQGVSRYDGQRWTTYTQRDGLAVSSLAFKSNVLALGPDDAVWYGSDLGSISRFDGQQWTTFDEVAGVRLNDVRWDLADRDGAMWFATSNGVVRYREGDWDAVILPEGLADLGVNAVAQDSTGALWFGTASGLSRLQHGTWTTYLSATLIYEVLCARDGTVWASSSRGFHHFDGHNWRLFPVPLRWVASALEDSRGDVWFGTWGSGVYRYDGAGLRSYGSDGISSHVVITIAEDPEGRLWFGTPGGARRYDGDEWLTFAARDGLPHDVVRDVFEDHDGHIWLATDGGVSRYDGTSMRHFTTADGLPPGATWTLAQDRGERLWMTSRYLGATGHASFDGMSWQDEATEAGLNDSMVVWDILSDRSGSLWFGTDYGLVRLERDLLSTDPSSMDHWSTITDSTGPGDNSVYSLAQDLHGDIWVGTAVGANRFDGEQWTAYTPEDGFARGRVRSILADREGRVWFASDGYGVTVFDGESFRILTTADGLAHNSLRSLMQDRDGHIWFGTDAGLVSRFDGEVFQTLTAEDGLTGQSVRSMIQDRRGDIWFGTYGGVVRFRQPRARPPSIGIDAVVTDRRHLNPRDLSVPSTVKLVVFEFHGASYRTRPDGMVYRYRLRGYDADWRTTRERRVEYTDLPAGDYAFEIVAVDRDLAQSKAPAVVVLEIHAPYERIALVSALVVALALVLLQGTRIVRRDRRLIEANRQIEEATRNKSQFLRRMSHDLRSPMNAIIGYTRLLRRRLADRIDERDARNLANIETSSGNLLNLINDILDLSRIEAGHVEMNLQPVDVRRITEECADALESIVHENVVLRRDLADVGVVNSDPDRLRQVVMNLLGNATKFTEAGSITLSLKRLDDSVELSVADTGIGIPAQDFPHIFDEFRQVERQGGETSEGTGLGLAIAKKTVELLGGEISATSEVGVGTTFLVRLRG